MSSPGGVEIVEAGHVYDGGTPEINEAHASELSDDEFIKIMNSGGTMIPSWSLSGRTEYSVYILEGSYEFEMVAADSLTEAMELGSLDRVNNATITNMFSHDKGVMYEWSE